VNVLVRARNGTHSFSCGPDDKVLHAALRSGVELPYECATGTCGTCRARVVSGRVETAWPEAPGTRYLKGEAEVLTCQGFAREDCELEAGMLKPPISGAARPDALTGRLRGLRRLTHDVVAFEVDIDRPLDFEAGQFVLLSVPGVRGARAYSMVNFERQAERLSFVVKKKPGGAVSEWLFGDGAVEGTPLGLFGPLGRAIFEPVAGKHVLCVAGGSGIAGMMSILARACAEGYFDTYDGHVFFGVRTERDAFFLDELETFRRRASGRLRVTVALSDEDVPEGLAARYPAFTFARGFVHAAAGEGMTGRFANLRAYAAGPPPMVDATLRWLLREVRLSPNDIRYDKFS